MSDRAAIIAQFLADAGWGDAARGPLAGDASFRRYERLRLDDHSAVLMDAPPPKEDVRPFVAVTGHLQALGHSAPKLLAKDEKAGLLLIEDLGDATFTRVIAEGADRAQLYEAAVDLLAHMHETPVTQTYAEQVPPYDEATLLREANLLIDWFIPAQIGHPIAPSAKRAYESIWQGLVPIIEGAGRTLVLRDFFADNLMWLPSRTGHQRVGLLDYQDALAGSPAYDLMSLIEDARRDMAPELEQRLLARYRAARQEFDAAAFDAAYVVLAAQRHAKVIGIFTRLAVRDGKFGYLSHIPRVWRLLERACRDPRLAALQNWLDTHVPPALRCAPELQEAAQ